MRPVVVVVGSAAVAGELVTSVGELAVVAVVGRICGWEGGKVAGTVEVDVGAMAVDVGSAGSVLGEVMVGSVLVTGTF